MIDFPGLPPLPDLPTLPYPRMPRQRRQAMASPGNPFDPTMADMGPMPRLGGEVGGAAEDYAPTQSEMGILPKVAGLISYAGETLDKGGSAVRGLLGGDPSQLANLIPFSDTLGLTNAAPGVKPAGFLQPLVGTEPITKQGSKIYGGDLLDKMGWKAPEEWSSNPALEAWSYDNAGAKILHGMAGFGIDVVTDPNTLWGLAPLTKGARVAERAGQAAVAAAGAAPEAIAGLEATGALHTAGALQGVSADVGKTAASMAQQIRGGERALFGLHLPFWARWIGDWLGVPKEMTHDPLLTGNLGLGSENAAKLMEWMGTGKWNPLRYVRGLFSSRAAPERTTFNAAEQMANDIQYTTRQRIGAEATNLKPLAEKVQAELEGSWQSISKYFEAAGDAKNYQDVSRSVADQQQRLLSAGDIIDQLHSMGSLPPNFTGDVAKEVNGFADKMSRLHNVLLDSMDYARKRYNSVGGQVKELNDMYAGWWRRSSSYAAKAGGKGVVSRMADEYKEDPRADAVRNNPTGTLLSNNMSRDHVWQTAERQIDPVATHQYVNAQGETETLTGKDMIERLKDPASLAEMTRAAGLAPGATAAEYIARLPEDRVMYSKIDKSALTDRLRTVLGLPEENTTPLKDLEIAYLRKYHIEPALDREWVDKTVPAKVLTTAADGSKVLDYPKDPATGKYLGNIRTTVDKETGELVPHTWESEQQRWGLKAKEGWEQQHEAFKAMHPDATTVTHAKFKAHIEDMYDNKATKDLIGYLKGFTDPARFKTGIYDRDIVTDAFGYIKSLGEKEATLRSAQVFLAGKGMTALAEDEPNWKPLADQTSEGVKTLGAWHEAKEGITGPKGGSGLSQEGLVKFAQDNYMTPEQLAAPDAAEQAKDIVNRLRINPQAAGGMNAFVDLTRERSVGQFEQFWDKLNVLYKSGLYSLWPMSHIRDELSRTFNAATQGKAPLLFGKGGGILGNWLNAMKYLRGNTVSDEFLTRIAEGQSAGLMKTFALEDIHNNPSLIRANRIPSGGAGYVLSPYVAGNNPLKMAIPGFNDEAVAAGTKHLPAPFEAGLRAQQVGDFAGRFGYFAALRDQNFTIAQAKSLVDQAFLTGDNLSAFERNLLSKVMPFERFTVRNLPYQLSKLAEEPGGMAAQVVRGTTEASSQERPDVYTPEFLREGQSIPGTANPQAQSFFRTTANPQAELNDVVMHDALGLHGVPDIGRTAENLASKLHPLAILGIERPWSDTGVQLHTGRKISDLEQTYSHPGWLPNLPSGLKSFVHYTPASRVLSEVENLADSRKSIWQKALAWSGMGRTSVYDVDKFQAIDTRQALEKSMTAGGQRTNTNYFLPEDQKAKMTPEAIEAQEAMRRRYAGLIQRLRDMARAKREAAAQGQ